MSEKIEEAFPAVRYLQLLLIPGSGIAVLAALACAILFEQFLSPEWAFLSALGSIPFFWALLVTMGFFIDFPRPVASVQEVYRAVAVAVAMVACLIEAALLAALLTTTALAPIAGIPADDLLLRGSLATFGICHGLVVLGILVRTYEDYFRIAILVIFNTGLVVSSAGTPVFWRLAGLAAAGLLLTVPFFVRKIMLKTRVA